MLASDVARHIVAHYGDAWFLTNLKLNMIFFWCQRRMAIKIAGGEHREPRRERDA